MFDLHQALKAMELQAARELRFLNSAVTGGDCFGSSRRRNFNCLQGMARRKLVCDSRRRNIMLDTKATGIKYPQDIGYNAACIKWFYVLLFQK